MISISVIQTELDAETIKQRVEMILAKDDFDYKTQWHLSGEPFLTREPQLIDAVTRSVEEVIGIKPALSTAGGTSDGRFISPTGAQVVELGPCNATIHKIDERIRISDIELLAKTYAKVLVNLERLSASN